MMDIKVIGIGSPFGDDQVGWEIVKQLAQCRRIQCYMPRCLSLSYHDRPGVRLLDLMKNVNKLFLVDAVVTGKTIGSYYRLQNEEIEAFKNLVSTHELGVAQTLQLARALNQLPKEIIFYGIEINPANLTFSISSSIECVIYSLVERMKNEIISCLAQPHRAS